MAIQYWLMDPSSWIIAFNTGSWMMDHRFIANNKNPVMNFQPQKSPSTINHQL